MWMTDMLSQWLAVPASLSTWPEMLGSECGFRKGAVCCVCAAGEAERKAGGPLGGSAHRTWTGRHPKVAEGTQREPRRQTPPKTGSLILPDMADSGAGMLCTPCPASQGRWRSARVT